MNTFKYQGYDATKDYEDFSKKTDLTRDSLLNRKKDSPPLKYLVQDKKWNQVLNRSRCSEVINPGSGRPESGLKSTLGSSRTPFVLGSPGSGIKPKERAKSSEGSRVSLKKHLEPGEK